MSRNSFYSRVGGFVIAMSLVFPAVSLAQSAALDEIIVIAQKREQNLQDVPISVTAFSGDMVDDFGFEDTRDIFYQTPNVDISQFSYSGGITIRGNPTLNNSLAGEGNVALYFDEEYIDNLGPIVAGEDHALGNMGLPQWYGVKFGMNF